MSVELSLSGRVIASVIVLLLLLSLPGMLHFGKLGLEVLLFLLALAVAFLIAWEEDLIRGLIASFLLGITYLIIGYAIAGVLTIAVNMIILLLSYYI